MNKILSRVARFSYHIMGGVFLGTCIAGWFTQSVNPPPQPFVSKLYKKVFPLYEQSIAYELDRFLYNAKRRGISVIYEPNAHTPSLKKVLNEYKNQQKVHGMMYIDMADIMSKNGDDYYEGFLNQLDDQGLHCVGWYRALQPDAIDEQKPLVIAIDRIDTLPAPDQMDHFKMFFQRLAVKSVNDRKIIILAITSHPKVYDILLNVNDGQKVFPARNKM